MPSARKKSASPKREYKFQRLELHLAPSAKKVIQPTMSVSGKASQKGGSTLDSQGYDAGKKVTGRKRHILVDTLGLLLNVAVHPANIQDRDGVALVLDRRTRRLFPFIERIYADDGY